MNENLMNAGTFEGYWAYATAPVVLFITLRIVRKINGVRKLYSKYLWVVTIVEVAVYLAALYSFGLLIEGVALGLGLQLEFVEEGQIPTLLLYLAAFTGGARFLEVWLITLDDTTDRLSASRLARTVLYGVGLLLGLLSFLVTHGYTFLSISTGAVAAILAFAVQRTMADLIAGVAMSIEGAFKIGEWIRLADGTEGEVIDIDWRATHLKGWDRAIMVFPNASLASQNFVRLPRHKHPYAQSYQISIAASQNPAQIKNLLEEAVKSTPGVLVRPAPAIRLADISNDPYHYSLWVHFENYMAMFAARDELFSNIHDLFKASGISVSPEVLDVRNGERENGDTTRKDTAGRRNETH